MGRSCENCEVTLTLPPIKSAQRKAFLGYSDLRMDGAAGLLISLIKLYMNFMFHLPGSVDAGIKTL